MKPDTSTGNRGLDLEEPLLFELGKPGRSGVDLPDAPKVKSHLGGLDRDEVGLPDLSEPEVIRHFVRISRNNYSIDANLYPLGSCTMKHNPRLNEKMARLPGFGDLHPMQPESTVQGALEMVHLLGHWLKTMTGMPAVAMPPAAGAHGELCGVMAIRAAHDAKGQKRTRMLIPELAHGTNPATAAQCGYEVDAVPGNDRGRMDLAAFKAKLGPDVAGVMLTNPNTLGLFENEVMEVAAAVHAIGGYFYADGANFNAIVGKAKPGDLGVDAIHINLHKTFSTPHGGGGPGSGPVAFSAALAPYAPLPMIVLEGDRFRLIEHKGDKGKPGEHSFGRLRSFHGQMGMFTRALTYMMSHGSDGLRQVAEDAVLSANYIMASLKDDMSAPFAATGPCMHEALFDDKFLEGTGITALDFAKAMIDEGYHPMTTYFPLVVHGALLTEPTETESKASVDKFIASLRYLARQAKGGDVERFKDAPKSAPRRRLDETAAARNPVLRWTPKATTAQAAE